MTKITQNVQKRINWLERHKIITLLQNVVGLQYDKKPTNVLRVILKNFVINGNIDENSIPSRTFNKRQIK